MGIGHEGLSARSLRQISASADGSEGLKPGDGYASVAVTRPGIEGVDEDPAACMRIYSRKPVSSTIEAAVGVPKWSRASMTTSAPPRPAPWPALWITANPGSGQTLDRRQGMSRGCRGRAGRGRAHRNAGEPVCTIHQLAGEPAVMRPLLGRRVKGFGTPGSRTEGQAGCRSDAAERDRQHGREGRRMRRPSR